MSPFKISGICLSLLVLSGCGNDPEPEKSLPPLVVDTAERFAPVELKIPGVGQDEKTEKGDVTVLALPDPNATADSAAQADAQTGDGTPAAADKPAGAISNADVPRPLILSDVVHSRFSNLLQGANEVPIIDAVFYPLGWSKDGKFAYAIEPPDEAVGSYFLNVYVQDLVTDKVLWSDRYQSPPESSKGLQSFAAYWMANETAMKARFKKYGIVPTQEGVLFAGPINYENDQIKYQVLKKLKAQPDLGNVAMVSEYQVEVASSRGKKSVHKETYKTPLSVLDVDVIGYLRGDDPERVAILVGGVKRGWEGPPHVTWFKVIGTNLRLGFKK
jgi:hypothetical protein